MQNEHIKIYAPVAVQTCEGFNFGVLVSVRTNRDAHGTSVSYLVDVYLNGNTTADRVFEIEREPGSSWTEFGKAMNEHPALKWALEASALRKSPPVEPEQFPPAATDCNTQPQSAA